MTKQKRRPPDVLSRRKTNRRLPAGEHRDLLSKVLVELPDGRYLIAYGRRLPDA
jgi:hypothetical protein